jgi:hypothetical protein
MEAEQAELQEPSSNKAGSLYRDAVMIYLSNDLVFFCLLVDHTPQKPIARTFKN